MNYFCSKGIRVGKSQQHTSTQTSLECPPEGGLCRPLISLGLTGVKIAPGKVIGDSNGDKFFSVWYCSKPNWNPVEWCGFFLQKKNCNITFSQHYELQKLHVTKMA